MHVLPAMRAPILHLAWLDCRQPRLKVRQRRGIQHIFNHAHALCTDGGSNLSSR